ncbi:hypothetical protein R3W88_001126 [Solanum pinnatisectum]|uniref:3-hydroxyacyl-CoA dehydrogenase NAD binding domain-containing protein n=1 Tax=Solanum pinnatisectum TaxID=50273 RepID=A0AAV9MK24_9SOLN|nr:hypothetical protein R3W88_001126 [Solanum pinnatisectum]
MLLIDPYGDFGNRRINYGWYLYIPLKIEKVVVIGGGLMGSGIVTTLILSSIQAILKEINFDYLQKSLKSIDDIFKSKHMTERLLCVKGDGNGDKLSTVASAMAPTLSSTGSTTTSTTQILSDFSLEIYDEVPWRIKALNRAGARDDKGNPIIRDYYESTSTRYRLMMKVCNVFLYESDGNTHDDMLLFKLEFVFNMNQGLSVWSEWLVFNRVNARARKGLVLGPMRLSPKENAGN